MHARIVASALQLARTSVTSFDIDRTMSFLRLANNEIQAASGLTSSVYRTEPWRTNDPVISMIEANKLLTMKQ